MRLGGWLRLWVVVGVTWGLVVTLVAYDGRPRAQQVRDAWAGDGLNMLAKYISQQEGTDVQPWAVAEHLHQSTADETIAYLERVEAKPKLSQLGFRDELIALNAKHRKSLAEFDSRWPSYVAKAVAAWIAPLLFLLAIGFTIRWVWRGFRPRLVENTDQDTK